MRSRLRAAISLLFGSVLLLGATTTSASPASEDHGAIWRQERVMLTVDDSVDALHADARAALERASSTWLGVPANLPDLRTRTGPADGIGYRLGEGNQNTVQYAAKGTPLAAGALAITVVTFDAVSRTIFDADVIINGEHAFGDLEPPAKANHKVYDLQNVLTHELGHLLGLADDDRDETAVMYPYLKAGDTSRRGLSRTDVDALVQLYSDTTDESPDYGGGCAASPNQPAKSLWLLALLGAGLVWRAPRRRAAWLGAGLVLAVSLPALGSSPASELSLEAVDATVESISTHWEDGLIVSELVLSSDDAPHALPASVPVWGGRIGNLVQVVGHAPPPRVGDELTLTLARDDTAKAWSIVTIQRQRQPRSAP